MTYKNKKGHSEPSKPPKGKITYIGPHGGTYTETPLGNKEYYGNNGK